MLMTQETELQQVVSIPEMIQNLNKVLADYPNVDPTKMFVEARSESEYDTRLVVTFAREATEAEIARREAQTRESARSRKVYYETLKKEFEGG